MAIISQNITVPVGLTDGSTASASQITPLYAALNNFTIPTAIFSLEFVSADQTVAASSTTTVAHGFGIKPKLFFVVLKCVTADIGFSVGDEVQIATDGFNGGASCTADVTNIIISNSILNLTRKDTHANTVITYANWKWVVRAWA